MSGENAFYNFTLSKRKCLFPLRYMGKKTKLLVSIIRLCIAVYY